jgi:sulfite exporter TauE/SafE
MLSTDTLALVYLATGFTVGFGHCIGMCGPIVVSFSLSLKNGNIYLPQGLYHTGRVLTYTILGGIMGATGSFTAVTAHMAGIQKGVFIFTGLLIVVMGLAMTGWLPSGKFFGDDYNLVGFISRGFKKLLNKATTPTFFPLGLLLGFLPCGPVYTALIGAARAGMESSTPSVGILTGMGLMFAFGIGTVPALILVGRLAGMKWLKNRAIIYKFGAILMILMGVVFVVKAFRF